LKEGDIKKRRSWLLRMLLTATFLMGSAVLAWRVWRMIERDIGNSPSAVLVTPSSISALLGSQAADEVGDMVFLNNVRLLSGPQPHIFIISGAKGSRMLVVSEDGLLPVERTPAIVDIKGQLRRLPSSAILRKQCKLSTDQVSIFGRQQNYIAAEYIRAQDHSAKAD